MNYELTKELKDAEYPQHGGRHCGSTPTEAVARLWLALNKTPNMNDNSAGTS